MFTYDPREFPEPGIAPFITVAELTKGTLVMGLAPVGVRWRGIVDKPGQIKPEGNCPRREFVPCMARVDRKWVNIK
jgi:hypothetical protein